MFKFLRNLFSKKDKSVEQCCVPAKVEEKCCVPKLETKISEEPVKVIEERLAEVAEKKEAKKEAKIKATKKLDETSDEVVKKPRRKRKPKPKTDKPEDGEQK